MGLCTKGVYAINNEVNLFNVGKILYVIIKSESGGACDRTFTGLNKTQAGHGMGLKI